MTVARSEQQTARVVSQVNAKARAEQVTVRVVSSAEAPAPPANQRPVVFVVT